MKTTLIQTITFGRDGNAADMQGIGWSVPEGGYTWSIGNRSSINIIDMDGPLLLEISGHPYLPKARPQQAIYVKAASRIVGSHVATRRSILGFIVPFGGLIEFIMPDASSPQEGGGSNDSRVLAFSFATIKVYAISRNVMPPQLPERPENVLAAFESIGDNCEFGFVQRAAGIEQLGLLRFSGQPLSMATQAFTEQFIKLDSPDNFELTVSGEEYCIAMVKYGMWHHTRIRTHETAAEDVLAQQVKIAPFLRRKLMDDIRAGERVLVYKQNSAISIAEILPLFAAIWRIGPANLLVARPADISHPAGFIEIIMPGLFVCYMGEFAEYRRVQATPRLQSAWECVCRQVLDLGSHQ